MDGETRGVARRLADGLETQQRQMDELDRKLGANKADLWVDGCYSSVDGRNPTIEMVG